jgi:hypothetical protein
LRGSGAGRTVTSMVDHVAKRADTRKQITVRLVGEVEARQMWLDVLNTGSKPGPPPPAIPKDGPTVTAQLRPGTTMNALLVWERTGKRPVGDPPWDLDNDRAAGPWRG